MPYNLLLKPGQFWEWDGVLFINSSDLTDANQSYTGQIRLYHHLTLCLPEWKRPSLSKKLAAGGFYDSNRGDLFFQFMELQCIISFEKKNVFHYDNSKMVWKPLFRMKCNHLGTQHGYEINKLPFTSFSYTSSLYDYSSQKVSNFLVSVHSPQDLNSMCPFLTSVLALPQTYTFRLIWMESERSGQGGKVNLLSTPSLVIFFF